jgi:hypothetical protein
VLLAVAETVFAGLPVSVSATVNGLLPSSTNGAGTAGSGSRAPFASIWSCSPPGTGAPSIVSCTVEFGVKPEAAICTPSLCGPCAVSAVT